MYVSGTRHKPFLCACSETSAIVSAKNLFAKRVVPNCMVIAYIAVEACAASVVFLLTCFKWFLTDFNVPCDCYRNAVAETLNKEL